MACMAKQHLVARGGTAMGVGRGVRRVVVGTQVGFDFHDAAGEETEGGTVNEELAQQTRSDEVGTVFEEGAGEKFAGKRSRTSQSLLQIKVEPSSSLSPTLSADRNAKGWGTGQLVAGPAMCLSHSEIAVGKRPDALFTNHCSTICALSSIP